MGPSLLPRAFPRGLRSNGVFLDVTVDPNEEPKEAKVLSSLLGNWVFKTNVYDLRSGGREGEGKGERGREREGGGPGGSGGSSLY